MSKTNRYNSVSVNVGDVNVGASSEVKLQSMTNTDTMDVDKSVEQIKKIVDNGAHYVRLTTQGLKEAKNLKLIKEELVKQGYDVPLVADVHFNPKVAELAAIICEKVRINPGNYSDKLTKYTYTQEEYEQEIETIKSRILPLIEICKENNTAIRIGTNHGSLSNRIVERYGDTPEGMVEATMEFLRIFKDADFDNVVVSLKASNTRVMVYATRLLVATMKEEGLCYPMHLGVTEAGGGDEGRIKSAVGIGTLLTDGIGDTIRVSLTENPENEIPVAKAIVGFTADKPVVGAAYGLNRYSYNRRKTKEFNGIGGSRHAVVLNSLNSSGSSIKPDFYCSNDKIESNDSDITMNMISGTSESKDNGVLEINLDKEKACKEVVRTQNITNGILLLTCSSDNIRRVRCFISKLEAAGCESPIIVKVEYNETDLQNYQIKAACDFGPLFIDGMIDGLWIDNKNFDTDKSVQIAFQILQASRVRLTQTEYISCPGCGRTLFDLEETAKDIKLRTSHLKHLKIGVMGCIVNGPGEMADADYGYVGSGKGKVTLYKGKEVVRKNIKSSDAIDNLIEVIKENGDWVEEI